jgi:7-cyano-7-deazaguanine synthase in queuosine biosynthesis
MDKRLARIRKMGGNDAKKITKYWRSEYYPWTCINIDYRGFRQALEADQAKHGIQDSYELDETVVDEFQQKIDDLIDIRAVDAATSSAQGDAAAVA